MEFGTLIQENHLVMLRSRSDLNTLLFAIKPENDHVKLKQGGKVVPHNQYTQESIDVRRVRKSIIKHRLYHYLKNGSTLILNRANWFSPKLQLLCNQVSRFGYNKTVANGYLAFGGESALGNHWDTHDVLAIQLIGRKRWIIYPPEGYELPLGGQRSRDYKDSSLGNPVFDGYLGNL